MPGNASNFLASDPNNPLLQLLAGRPRYGRAGGKLFDGDPNAAAHLNFPGFIANDPRYFERYLNPGSEAGGGEERYRLNDSTNQMLTRNGERYSQVYSMNVGGDAGEIIDPSLVIYDEELGLISPNSNFQADPNGDGWQTAMMVAAGGLMGGAALAHQGLLGGAASSGGSGGGGGWGVSAGGSGGVGAGGSGSASVGMGAGGLGNLGAEAINYETLPNIQGPPPAQFPADPSLLSRAGTWVANNPLQAGRAALGLASLGAGLGGGSGGGGGGGSGDANSIIEQMANANRVNHNTPLGSRNWAKGPDGRWTMNDTMDPAEEANFRNVQGMNASVTDMARQRLAALLAQGPSPRADRPINAHGFNIGG